MARKTSTPPTATDERPNRRPPQFALAGLLGVMGVAAVAMTPLYYFFRGYNGDNQSMLVGMLMILAGPLLLVVIVSSLLAVFQWFSRR